MSDKGSNKETDKTKKTPDYSDRGRYRGSSGSGVSGSLPGGAGSGNLGKYICQRAWRLKGLTIEEAEEAVQQKFVEDYQDAAVTVTLEGAGFSDSDLFCPEDGCLRRNPGSV